MVGDLFMGLFSRNNATDTTAAHVPATLPRKAKPFRIELGWRGMFSLLLVIVCLLFWMFVLGIWAGQTILFPQRGERPVAATVFEKSPPARMADQSAPSR